MDPHPLANIFKISDYDEPISSDLSALDYRYEVFLEIRESENCVEEIYEEIHDSPLNKKHDCKQRIDLTKKRRKKKERRNKTANFCEVGERKTRGKWRIM